MRANLIQKKCINCELTKPRLANFSKNPKQPDFFAQTCRQCKQEIRDGLRKPITHNQRRELRSSRNGLLLAAVWAGYSDWSEASASYHRGNSNLRGVPARTEVGNTLGTTAPQTTWRY